MNSDGYKGGPQAVTGRSPDPERTKHRRTRGPRVPGRQPKHGGRALARHLAAGTLDGRTWVARALAELGDALAADRGGWANVTAAERILIERCAAETLMLRAIEAWVFRQPDLVTSDGEGPRLLAPLAKGYTSHLGALTRALTALGIRPDKVERLPALEAYLASREATGDASPGAQAAPSTRTDDTPAVVEVPPAPPDAAATALRSDAGDFEPMEER